MTITTSNTLTAATLRANLIEALGNLRINYGDILEVRLEDGCITIHHISAPHPWDYDVQPLARIIQHLGLDTIAPNNTFEVVVYTYNEGNEQVFTDRPVFAGVYHPDSACEGDDVCKFCGSVLATY